MDKGVPRQFSSGLHDAVPLQTTSRQIHIVLRLAVSRGISFIYAIDLAWTLKQELMATFGQHEKGSHNEMVALEALPWRMKSH